MCIHVCVICCVRMCCACMCVGSVCLFSRLFHALRNKRRRRHSDLQTHTHINSISCINKCSFRGRCFITHNHSRWVPFISLSLSQMCNSSTHAPSPPPQTHLVDHLLLWAYCGVVRVPFSLINIYICFPLIFLHRQLIETSLHGYTHTHMFILCIEWVHVVKLWNKKKAQYVNEATIINSPPLSLSLSTHPRFPSLYVMHVTRTCVSVMSILFEVFHQTQTRTHTPTHTDADTNSHTHLHTHVTYSL
jgi:hypothetical protein